MRLRLCSLLPVFCSLTMNKRHKWVSLIKAAVAAGHYDGKSIMMSFSFTAFMTLSCIYSSYVLVLEKIVLITHHVFDPSSLIRYEFFHFNTFIYNVVSCKNESDERMGKLRRRNNTPPDGLLFLRLSSTFSLIRL